MATEITQIDTSSTLNTSVTHTTSTYTYPGWYGWGNWYGWNWGHAWNYGLWNNYGNIYNGYFGYNSNNWNYWGYYNHWNAYQPGGASYGYGYNSLGYGFNNIGYGASYMGNWNWGWWGVGAFRTSSQTVATSTTTNTSISQLAYMRSRLVNISAKGLRPSTRVYPFFDDIRVDAHVKPQIGSIYGDITFGSSTISNVADIYGQNVLLPSLTPVTGDGIASNTYIKGTGVGGSAPYGLYNASGTAMVSLYTLKQTNIKLDKSSSNWGDALITSGTGDLEAVFNIPNSSSLKFTVGSKIFKLSDSTNPSVSDESTSAQAEYQASGAKAVVQNTVNRTVVTTNTTRVFAGLSFRGWFDPLAESFLLSGSENEGGVFITSIDCYFQAKDTTLPIILEMRTMDNGFPSQNLVDKAAQVVVYPDNVNVSADSSVPTSFRFSHPIYVESDTEYCFSLRSNSNKYMVWKATMGEKKVQSTETISKQPYMGVMFMSQNNSTWTADQYSDLKFNLFKAKFDSALRTGDKVGKIVLKNNLPKNKIAVGSIFELKPSSKEIIVRVPDHGLNINSKVKLKVNPFIATTTSGSTNLVLSDSALIAGGTPLIATGTPVGGPGIPYGATVTVSGSTVTLSAAATASGVVELYFGWVTVGRDTSTNKAIEAYKVSYNRSSGSVSTSNDTTGTGAFDVTYADNRTIVFTADGTTQADFSINTINLTGNATISTNTLTGTSITSPTGTIDYNTLAGYTVSGTGVPAGATVVSAVAGTITMSVNASSSTTGGTTPYVLQPADRRGSGSVVLAVLEPDTKYETIHVSASDHSFIGTSLDYYMKLTSGVSTDQSVAVQIPYIKDTSWVDFNPNADIAFNTPRTIASNANSINPANNISGSSLDVKIQMNTTNNNLSPVVDLPTISAAAISNVLDNPTIANRPYDNLQADVLTGAVTLGSQTITVGSNINRLLVGMYIYLIDVADYSAEGIYITAIDSINSTVTISEPLPVAAVNSISFVSGQIVELDPYRGITASKYVISPITITNPATAIRVMFAASLVSDNAIDVYFKSVNINDSGSQQIYEKPWVQLPSGSVAYATTRDQFFDLKYELNGITNPFDMFMVKVVFRGTNSCFPPKIKDFRCLALAS
jgi:hypothetical protein